VWADCSHIDLFSAFFANLSLIEISFDSCRIEQPEIKIVKMISVCLIVVAITENGFAMWWHSVLCQPKFINKVEFSVLNR